MSCPNCLCTGCQAERARWQKQGPMPYWPQKSDVSSWYLCASCGKWTNGPHTCVTMSS